MTVVTYVRLTSSGVQRLCRMCAGSSSSAKQRLCRSEGYLCRVCRVFRVKTSEIPTRERVGTSFPVAASRTFYPAHPAHGPLTCGFVDLDPAQMVIRYCTDPAQEG
jgi:hypothetical protein